MGCQPSKPRATPISDFKTGKKISSSKISRKPSNNSKRVVGGEFFTKTKKSQGGSKPTSGAASPSIKVTQPRHQESAPAPTISRPAVEEDAMMMEDIDDDVSEIDFNEQRSSGQSRAAKSEKRSNSSAVSPNHINLGPANLFDRNFDAESKNAEFFLQYTRNRLGPAQELERPGR
mmetsp:Transcript_19810/g.32265  ORF Transcript_19810/g.32265 Transcript_19810/m.32265 type:complete len:175 (+) Transcript_19810:137-661(+)